MTFLQSIWSDLVERRLLPVAIVLVAALVAIPFVITGKDSGTPTQLAGPIDTPGNPTGLDPQTLRTPGPQALSSPQVKLLQASTRHASSKARDPFTQPKVKVKDTTIITATPPTSSSSGGNKGGGGGGSTPYVAPNPYVAPKPTPKPSTPASPDDFTVTLRVGQAGDLVVHKGVERLTPLPSTIDPFFVYMGVTDAGKTAVFLLSSDAKATGDGTCKPSATNCQTVEMKADDVEFFDVAGAAGAPSTQYELDLTRIVKTKSTTKAISSQARTASTRTGAAVVSQTRSAGSAAVSGYAYDARTGTLNRRLPTLAAELANIASKSGH